MIPAKIVAAFRAVGAPCVTEEAYRNSGFSARDVQILDAYYRKHGATVGEFAYDPASAERKG